MISSPLLQLVLNHPRRLAMPIAVHPGIALTHASVQDLVTNAQAQFEAAQALHERYATPVVLAAMDLSVEAEAFGCQIRMVPDEVPTVTGRLVGSEQDVPRLPEPQPGDGRTGIYLRVVEMLGKLTDRPLVLAGSIGPFSLAARLAGVNEALSLTLTEPDFMRRLVEKSTAFLIRYGCAFKSAGAGGLIMAEPAAGLLSPRGLAAFSSAFVRQIIEALQDEHFTLVLHNCAAKLPHLPSILQSGAAACHFGVPMDMAAALAQAGPDRLLCGNLDPAAVFCQGTPDSVAVQTRALLQATRPYPNFVISSGCDIPAQASLENLDAFYATVAGEGE